MVSVIKNHFLFCYKLQNTATTLPKEKKRKWLEQEQLQETAQGCPGAITSPELSWGNGEAAAPQHQGLSFPSGREKKM